MLLYRLVQTFLRGLFPFVRRVPALGTQRIGIEWEHVTPDFNEYFRWTVLALTAMLVGWLLSSLAWGIAAGLVGLVILNWLDFRELVRWSAAPLTRPTARSVFWGTPLDRLYRTIRASRERSRSLANRLRFLETTADGLPDAWVVVRGIGEIEQTNAAAELLLGLGPQDQGQNLLGLLRDPALVALMNGEAEEKLIEIASPINDRLRLEVRRIPLRDRTLVIARDVTELNRLLSMRQDFIANVSHELRTPLTVILGYLESIADEPPSPKLVAELARRLSPPAQRMKSLVDDLLTLTRLESAPLPNADTIEPVDGGKLLLTLRLEAEQLSNGAHELIFDVEPNLVIECVPNELQSAFSNLIANAIRYSPQGGRITARWFRSGDGARFEVEDHGIGIAPEHLSRITERFYRIDLPGSRVRGGTGLGLAIVKHILRRHNTRLQVESELGKGSLFICTFALKHQIASYRG